MYPHEGQNLLYDFQIHNKSKFTIQLHYCTLQVSWNRGYEPYIVGIKDDLPSYNTAFVGRYMDKISHLLHVHAMG